MESPTKENLQQDAHPVHSAPEASEASAANPREENCCCACSKRTGTITIAIIYLLVHLSVLGICIVLFWNEGIRDSLTVLWVTGVLGIAVIFISLLLYGAIKRRPPYLLAWMWWEGISIALVLVSIIISTLSVGSFGSSGVVGLAIRCFCFSFVHAYRKTLIAKPPKREDNNAMA